MKIIYKVLWIEDQPDGIKSFIKGLTKKLDKYGFKFEVIIKTTLNNSELVELGDKLSRYNPYDIIFFDYDLGDIKGDDIAFQLRKAIYTDMIFYSGLPGVKLRKTLFDKKIDGVFIVDRSNFIDDTWPIIEDQIKRICDINNMRGVLLDEMSKIDLNMRSLYKSRFEGLEDPNKEEQITKFKEKLKNRIESLTTQVGEINSTAFSEMIENPLKVEFNIVRSRLKSISGDDELFGEKSELKLKQDLRNKFAHNMAIYNDEEGTVRLSGYEEEYGFDEFTKIRRELIDLQERLDKITEN